MKSSQKKPLKTKEKVTFKLEFHATKVPRRGWDRLLVSLVSVETGKVIAKTGKAPVKNGSCFWSDPVFESTFLSWDIDGKSSDKKLYKLVVSMGLSRFGILGEATIDMTEYTLAHVPVSLSLPLQNCNFGSLLHVKIKRAMQKDVDRELEDEGENSSSEVPRLDGFESNAIEEKDDCVPPRYSIDSVEVPLTPDRSESRFHIAREGDEVLMSPSSSISSYHEPNGFQYYPGMTGIDSKTQSPLSSDSSCDEMLALTEWTDYKSKDIEAANSAIMGTLKSKAVLRDEETKEVGIEIRALRRQLVEEITKNEELQKMVTTLSEEQESLKWEKEKSLCSSKLNLMGIEEIRRCDELQEELEYEKNVNSNLTLQLRKTQDSNSELLLEIQDLEKALQEKKDAVHQSSDLRGLEIANEDLKHTVDTLHKELEEIECDSKELTEENMNLISQLKQSNDKAKVQDITISQLENAVTDLRIKIGNKSDENDEAEVEKLRETVCEMREKLKECEESYEIKLASSRTFIDDLNSSVMMLRSRNIRLETEIQSLNEHTSEVLKEVQALKRENDGKKEEIQVFQQQTLNLLNEVESLKMENERHEKEKSLLSSQQGQLRLLKEKATKAEEERKNVLQRVEELETTNRSLREKVHDFTKLKKKLADTQEHLSSTDSKYKESLQLMSCIKAEKIVLEEQMSNLLEAKKEAEATIAQVKIFNDILQEKLTLEELKSAELLQRCEDDEAKYLALTEKMNMNLTQLKAWEDEIMESKNHEKEMENKIQSLQEENKTFQSQIKELEENVSVLEETIVSLKSSKSAIETISKGLQIFNDELSQKLKNAQEDIEWARENTNTLVNEIRELEGELESDSEVRNHLEQTISELEGQKANLQTQVGKLLENVMKLEKEVMDHEERYNDAVNEIASLQVLVKQKQEIIDEYLSSDNENKEKAELEEKLTRSQERLNQLTRDVSDSEIKQMQTLSDVLILKAQKVELEEALQKSQEILDVVKNEASIMKEDLELKLHEAMLDELNMKKHLEEAMKESKLLKDENLDCSQKIMELETKCTVSELDKEKTYAKMVAEVRNKSAECEFHKKEKEATKKSLASLKQEKYKVEASLENTVEELTALKERLQSQEEANFKERNNEVSKLTKQIAENQHKLSEQEVEREDLKKRIYSLEEELAHQTNALVLSQKKLRDKEASSINGVSPVSHIARYLSRESNKVGPLSNLPPTQEAKEAAELREKVKILDGEVKKKADELEISKQQLKEQYSQFSLRIEHLELANKQLMKECSNSNLDKILQELDNLQKQNAVLSERQVELLAKLCVHESLQHELENVKEEKKELENALSKFSAAATSDNILKKISSLEVELGEVLEANNMYKKQLQSAFSQQQNVHIAALQNLGSAEQILEDLADLKRKNSMLNDELKDMKDRYFNISLQFAEVEAERGQLIMTIKTLQGARKFMHNKSANF